MFTNETEEPRNIYFGQARYGRYYKYMFSYLNKNDIT